MPPKKHLYLFFNISYINEVVVVFPSLPVTAIVLQGDNSITSSISDVNFGKDDVYRAEDNWCIHHEYIDCPECNEQIMLSDDEWFGN